MSPWRAALLVAAGAWLVALGVLYFGVRPNLAHTLGHLWGDAGSTLPVITTAITLPVLGMARWPVGALLWGGLLAGPVVVGAQALRLPEDRFYRFLLAALPLYLALAGLLGVLFFSGLFLPFALL